MNENDHGMISLAKKIHMQRRENDSENVGKIELVILKSSMIQKDTERNCPICMLNDFI